MKYRKRPVLVDAFQYDGSFESAESMVTFGCGKIKLKPGYMLAIESDSGVVMAGPSDWIIKGTAGEFYPCKAEVFKTIYSKTRPRANKGER